MRISDWSSDVCSSDLGAGRHRNRTAGIARNHHGHSQEQDRKPRRRRRDHPTPKRDDPAASIAAELCANQEAVSVQLFVRRVAGSAWRDRPFTCPAFEQLVRDGAPAKAEGERNRDRGRRSEEHTSELQSLMRNSYAVFCLKKNNTTH